MVEKHPRTFQAGLLASLAGRGRVDVVLAKGMWGWRRLQFGPGVPPTAGTLPRLQTAVTAYSYIPSNGHHGQAGVTVPSAGPPQAVCPYLPPGECPPNSPLPEGISLFTALVVLSCEQLVGEELRSLEVLNVLEAVWCLRVTSSPSCLPCGVSGAVFHEGRTHENVGAFPPKPFAVALIIVLSCPFLGLLSHLRNALGSNVRRTASGGEDRTGGEAQAQGSLHPGMLIWGDCSPSLDIISSFAETAVNLL